MSAVATVVLPFFGLIALGYGAARRMRLPGQGVSGLILFVYYFAMPAWFFFHVAQTPFRDIAHWSFLAATTFSTYCAFAIAFSFAALLIAATCPTRRSRGSPGPIPISAIWRPP